MKRYELVPHTEEFRKKYPTLPTHYPRRITGKLQGPCVHLGAQTGERVKCATCKGNWRLSLFACAVHGTCTTETKTADAACCRGCGDYQAK